MSTHGGWQAFAFLEGSLTSSPPYSQQLAFLCTLGFMGICHSPSHTCRSNYNQHLCGWKHTVGSPLLSQSFCTSFLSCSPQLGPHNLPSSWGVILVSIYIMLLSQASGPLHDSSQAELSFCRMVLGKELDLETGLSLVSGLMETSIN